MLSTVSSFRPISPIRTMGVNAPGSAVHPKMLEKLKEAGVKDADIVHDAKELRADTVEKDLEKKHFKREEDREGGRVFAQENAKPYLAGQRAFFDKNGSVSLWTFAGQFIQATEIDANGKVKYNSVERIPV